MDDSTDRLRQPHLEPGRIIDRHSWTLGPVARESRAF